MKKINSLSELREERKQLQRKKMELETLMKSDIQELKEELDPSRVFAKTVSKLLMSKEEGIIGHSLGSFSNYLVKKIIFRNSGFFTKFALGYAARNITSRMFSEKKAGLLKWVSIFLQKIRKKEKTPVSKNSFANQEY